MSEVNDPETIDEALRIRKWQTTVNEESIPEDFLEPLSGNINYPSGSKPITLPDAAFLKLDSEASTASDVTIALFKTFYGDIGEGGQDDPRGTEESLIQKSFKMECNDIWHVHTAETYGKGARDKAPYKFTEASAKNEGLYFKQAIGRYRRHALVEGQSSNLLANPFYNSAMLNPHWFVPGVDDDIQPNYSMVYENFTDSIVHALNHAGLGIDAAVSPHFINRLQEWCFAHLDPLEDGDGQYFILALPSNQVTWLKHPTNQHGLGQYWRIPDTGSKSIRYHLPGLVGQIGKMMIVEDMLAPSLTISGSPSKSATTHDGTMTIQYRGMGKADDGSSDPRDVSASGRQLGIVIGNHAICEWFPEPLHWESDWKQYDRKYGTGLFGVYGCKIPAFNKTDSNHSNTFQYEGSCIVPFAKPPREGYASE
jgi:hypothetical protein